jgi:uncharacterized protein YfaS (alpha-2-macroglobulin family)
MSLISFLLALLSFWPLPAESVHDPAQYPAVKAKAEESYTEKSFRHAHDLYVQAGKNELPVTERRWVDFRIADTAWRDDAASPSSDPTARNGAQAALEELIRKSGDDHDRVWAEANESLGDLFAFHPYARNYTSQQYWTAALDWWEGSDDLPLARKRFLNLVWHLSETNNVSRDVLVKAVSIAESQSDRDRARLLLARQFLSDGNPESIERGLEHLDYVIREGRQGSFYDEALSLYADQLANTGNVVVLESGESGLQRDYVKALDLYRRIVAEYQPGTSQFRQHAEEAIQQITRPAVMVIAGTNFLPSSEQEVVLSWRNVTSIEMSLVAVDLTTDVQTASMKGNDNWVDTLRTEGKPVLRRWTLATSDRGDHAPGSQKVRITPKVGPGAYVLTARNGDTSSRQLLLVTETGILVHSYKNHIRIFLSNVLTGEPVPGARVHVLRRNGAQFTFSSYEAKTDANGLADVRIAEANYGLTLITATIGNKQAYDTPYTYYSGSSERLPEWRVYAFTDRPAYRPGETVHWKIIARAREGETWSTPSGQHLEWTIMSPRGEKVASGIASLNAFGSFWTDLPVTPAMPLGVYRIEFTHQATPDKPHRNVGSAVLFGIEEYKLPEFRVSVTTPEENGKKKQYRLGDTIEASIEATYYFGGPVANATVDVEIAESAYARYWSPWHEYGWYYDPQPVYYGGGGQSRHETLKTDATGHAVLRIETNRDGGDKRFTIAANVTDASRRVVTGRGIVAVMQHHYNVSSHPQHYLRLPNERASVDFNAADANDQPVQTTGTVKVLRRTWEEVWIDPAGHEVSGHDLERAKTVTRFFPTAGWRQKSAMYRDEEVTTSKVTTDAKGNGTFTFTPSRTGYYLTRWTSEDGVGKGRVRARDLVTSETAIWVTEHATNEAGYHSAGLDLILDQDTVRIGTTMQVLIATPSSGRWVVLTTGTDDIQTQVIHLDGTVKLVQIPIDARHAPNFFLTASSIFDRALATETRRVVVPPAEKFVTVDVRSDRESYEPRQKGTVTLTTRDAAGKPVSAEVSLAVSDESVSAIRADASGDPRPFFYGDLRPAILQVAASVQSQRFVRLVEGEQEVLVDEEIAFRQKDEIEKKELDGVRGGSFGYANEVEDRLESRRDARTMPAPPPPAPMIQAATVMKSVVGGVLSGVEGPATISVEVRSDFSSTAFWKPDVLTDANGKATVAFSYPESLTTWQATARAVTADSQFGMASSTTRTSMPLIVRLEGPRFFVAGDHTVISAVINNNTDDVQHVTPSLDVEGVTLTGRVNGDAKIVDVPAMGETRVEWGVVADRAGAAKLRVTARGSAHGDAMEKSFTVYEHGIDKLVARSGKLRGAEALVRLDLPAARRATSLSVQISPSLAVTMLDALPYLIDYPYGCTEQTMSRFLPAAIVARTLAMNGLDPGDLDGRMFGGIEAGFATATHGQGKKDLHRLEAMTSASMNRLYDFQHNDGGWGWWKTGDSDPFMTAYVVWGFAVAREGGLAVKESAVGSAVPYLERHLASAHGDYASEAWTLHALAAWQRATHQTAHGKPEALAFDDVYEHRERLTAYSRALLALAAHDFGDAERARVLVRNLEDGVKIDRTPDQSVLVRGGSSTAETMSTAHWGEDRFWWHWYDGPVETTSFALQALVAVDPKNELIEPVMNWLVKNRRGAQWSNTRDTAIALLGLNDYLRNSGELKGDTGYELSVNGHAIASRTIKTADVLGAPSRFNIDPSFVRDGTNEITIRRTQGSGTPLYFSAEARFVSLEEPVKAAGNEIFVRRDYFKLVPHPTLLKGVVYEKAPLTDGGSVNSGDRVEVVVTVDSKNDYDYLLLEDLKPAGLEAIALQSGEPLYAQELRSSTVTRKFVDSATVPGSKQTIVRRDASSDVTGRSAWIYQELRDRKVAMFINHLPQGIWEIRYTLRAEVPGSFHALPLLAQAMYVPEVRANGEEVRIEVK